MGTREIEERIAYYKSLSAAREAEEAAAEPKPAEARLAREKWLAGVGFGPQYWAATWEQVPKALASALHRYCDEMAARLAGGQGLMIGGGMGVGKTQALSLVALAARDVRFQPPGEPLPRQPVVRYVFGPRLYAAWFRRTQEEPALVVDASRADLLLLDDFDRIHLPPESGDWIAGRVEQLAETRYAWQLATIVTLNNEAPLGDPRLQRTLDRWCETMTRVVVAGPTRRAAG